MPGINAIMPMINTPVHTLETQYHIMSINKKTTNFLNESQTPIDVCDQPVYALTRIIQWKYPHEFGLGHYFSLLGGLHIEQQNLVLHGELINGSGLKEILDTNELSIIGTSVAVDVNDIKRARYCLQVVACVMFMKLKDAHKNSGSSLPLMQWLEERVLTSEMCYYWKLILDFQVLILTFIRSIREGNFQVYIESFVSIVKWYFALDHYNYARWSTVHCFDLMMLEKTCPDLHEQFELGNFSFQKTNSEYSRIALDQVHEQNNKVIKGSGGSKHLLNRSEESGLIRWECIGADIARILCEFEDSVDETSTEEGTKKHHEDTKIFQERFYGDVKKVYTGMSNNPFEYDKLTAINNPTCSFPEEVFDSISKLEKTGEKQFNDFLDNRLNCQKIPINEKIKKNKFVLMGNVDKSKTAKENPKDVKMKQTVITKLRAALSFREKECELLFESELYEVAQSISASQTTLYHSRKSQLLQRFAKAITLPLINESIPSAIIIELSAIIQIKGSSDAESFHDFAVIIFYYIMELSKGFSRIDIVADQYFDHSVKEQTRNNRGVGTRKQFEDTTKIPKKHEKTSYEIAKTRKI